MNISVYYGNWKIYDRAYPLCDIPFDKIDRLYYIFTDPTGGKCTFADPELELLRIQTVDGRCSSKLQPETDPLKGNMYQLKVIKQRYPNLKVFFVIGGMIYTPSMHEYIMTNDTEKMKGFVSSCVKLFQIYSFAFDGIDIDYEYPCLYSDKTCGITPAFNEKQLFLNFISEFRNQLGSKPLISLAISAEYNKLQALDLVGLNNLVDIFNIMSYDLTSGSQGDAYTGHHSQPKVNNDDPLYYRRQKSAELASKYCLNYGVKADKINIGVAFYGRGFMIGQVNPKKGPFFPTSGELKIGTWDIGQIEYYDLKNNYMTNQTTFFDAEAQAPYIADANKGWFITYEDETSIEQKRKLVENHGYDGLFGYELTGDDDKNTLLNAMKYGPGYNNSKGVRKEIYRLSLFLFFLFVFNFIF